MYFGLPVLFSSVSTYWLRSKQSIISQKLYTMSEIGIKVSTSSGNFSCFGLELSRFDIKELAGEIVYEGFLPPNSTDEQLRAKMAELPENTLYRDGIEYYGLTHRHPNATGSYTTESFMKLMAFDVEDRMDLINQPLLMIAGEKADTLYMTNDAYAKATGAKNKELFLIPGASHIRTYWVPEYVDKAVAKLAAFYKKNL